MYKEAQALSEEVLEVYPDDDAAKANAKAAKNSLSFRSKGMAQAVPMVALRPNLCVLACAMAHGEVARTTFGFPLSRDVVEDG